jgi:hypothetical protein
VEDVIKRLAIIFEIYVLAVEESHQIDSERAKLNRMMAQTIFSSDTVSDLTVAIILTKLTLQLVAQGILVHGSILATVR